MLQFQFRTIDLRWGERWRAAHINAANNNATGAKRNWLHVVRYFNNKRHFSFPLTRRHTVSYFNFYYYCHLQFNTIFFHCAAISTFRTARFCFISFQFISFHFILICYVFILILCIAMQWMHAAMRTHITYIHHIVHHSYRFLHCSLRTFSIQLVKNCIRHLRRHSQK